jgi:hypothetical protein
MVPSATPASLAICDMVEWWNPWRAKTAMAASSIWLYLLFLFFVAMMRLPGDHVNEYSFIYQRQTALSRYFTTSGRTF